MIMKDLQILFTEQFMSQNWPSRLPAVTDCKIELLSQHSVVCNGGCMQKKQKKSGNGPVSPN